MEAFKGLTGLPVFFGGLAFVVIPFLMGQFLDAIRDLLENIWDRKYPINWDFFIEGDKDKLESFQEFMALLQSEYTILSLFISAAACTSGSSGEGTLHREAHMLAAV
jgi:hypothetical protein